MHPLAAWLSALVLALSGPLAQGTGPTSPAPRHAVWPLQPRPRVVEGFHRPDSPWGPGHRGVDLLGHPGEAVHAARAGTITFAANLAGRGVVVVDHGAERTTYEPVRADVVVGQHVGAGTVIGTLEIAMSHCFPRACLHWGLIRGRDTYLDPLTLVGGGPVRLLPWDGLAIVTRAGARGGTPYAAARW